MTRFFSTRRRPTNIAWLASGSAWERWSSGAWRKTHGVRPSARNRNEKPGSPPSPRGNPPRNNRAHLPASEDFVGEADFFESGSKCGQEGPENFEPHDGGAPRLEVLAGQDDLGRTHEFLERSQLFVGAGHDDQCRLPDGPPAGGRNCLL